MGYAKYTEDDNEIRMERYQSFEYSPYFSEYHFPHPTPKQNAADDYFYLNEKYFYRNKEE